MPKLKIKGAKDVAVEAVLPNSFTKNPNIPDKQVFDNDSTTVKIMTITLTGSIQENPPGSGIYQVTDGDALIEVEIG